MGQTVKVFLSLSAGEDASPEDLIAFARGRFAGYKIPRAIEIVDSLPTTSTGKIQKFVLRERG